MLLAASNVRIRMDYANEAPSPLGLETTITVSGLTARSITRGSTDEFTKRLEKVMSVRDAACRVSGLVTKGEEGYPFTAYLVSTDDNEIGFFSFKSSLLPGEYGIQLIMDSLLLSESVIDRMGVIFKCLVASISSFRGRYIPIHRCVAVVGTRTDIRLKALLGAMGFVKQETLDINLPLNSEKFVFTPV